jgi:hypothetical protein
MNQLDQAAQLIGISLRVNAVADIKHMPRPSSRPIEDGPALPFHDLPWPQEHQRIEVALHGSIVADPLPGAIQRYAPVDADGVAARIAHGFEQGGGSRAEVD